MIIKLIKASSALQVKQIEKRDSVLTSKNQIDRLTRPGSSYFNLNPFEVSLNILSSYLNVAYQILDLTGICFSREMSIVKT